MLRKANTFRRQAVKVRCFDLLLPITAELSITEIIGIYVDDVWRVGRTAGAALWRAATGEYK